MRKSMIPFLCFLAAIQIYSSCNKQKDIDIAFKYNYYPLQVGSSIVYRVDSIIYNPLFANGKDTATWEVKETIESAYTDNTGETAYRIERYIRKDSSHSWKSPVIWSATRTKTRAERVENNLRFVKLVFPASEGMSWEGNSYLKVDDSLAFYQDWLYEITSADAAESVNGISFDSVLTVSEVDDENLLERRWSMSKYAAGVGLAYREQYNLQFVGTNIPALPWEEKATHGFIVKLQIISYQ